MSNPVSRRALLRAGVASGAAAIVLNGRSRAFADSPPIKVGMTSIFSGRVAQMGISSKNALLLQFDAFNAAGGLGGRKIELVDRDSKGKPEEAARLTRELIESEGCEIILCAEASGSSFAAHEVARASNVLCIHIISETTQLTADPKLRAWNVFRTSRQALHDSIVGGNFAAQIAKQDGLTRWATISADYAYGREATPEFMSFVRAGGAKVDLVAEAWPKLFQPDYTENITRLLQARPQAMFCGLWGGDLVAFIDQGNLFGLFDKVKVFSIHMADYTTMSAVKNVPKSGIYSSNRYVSTFPDTAENVAWAETYVRRFGTRPTNWSWEADTGARFLIEALRKTGNSQPKVLAEAIRGAQVLSPVGMRDGRILMEANDQTIVDYALGWGRVIPDQPYLVDIQAADWPEVLRTEAEWKKSKGFI
jgi:branched-chain amino acid transport system substrate-binding protein